MDLIRDPSFKNFTLICDPRGLIRDPQNMLIRDPFVTPLGSRRGHEKKNMTKRGGPLMSPPPSKKSCFSPILKTALTFPPSVVVEKDWLGVVLTWLRAFIHIFYIFSKKIDFRFIFEAIFLPKAAECLQNP